MHVTENWNTTHSSTTEQISTQEDKINVALIKKTMSEHKTTLASVRIENWEKLKVES